MLKIKVTEKEVTVDHALTEAVTSEFLFQLTTLCCHFTKPLSQHMHVCL